MPLIRASLFGGLILFIWGAFSWMVLPWHDWTFNSFGDERFLAQIISEYAPNDGVYLLPNFSNGMPKDDTLSSGPFMFAVVNTKGIPSNMTKQLVVSFFIQCLSAFFMSVLLFRVRGLAYWERVGFVVLVAVLSSIMCQLPLWNWWGFSASYTIISLLDLTLGWFLAALYLSKI